MHGMISLDRKMDAMSIAFVRRMKNEVDNVET